MNNDGVSLISLWLTNYVGLGETDNCGIIKLMNPLFEAVYTTNVYTGLLIFVFYFKSTKVCFYKKIN